MTITVLSSDASEVLVEGYYPNTPPHELYAYWVEPDGISQWWVPQVTLLDVRDGGQYQFDWGQQGWTLRGTFSHVIPNEQFYFTWAWDHLPNMPQRLVEVYFVLHAAGGTVLQVRQSQYDTSERDQEDRQNHMDGWAFFLKNLYECCEIPED